MRNLSAMTTVQLQRLLQEYQTTKKNDIRYSVTVHSIEAALLLAKKLGK